ncbi:hypothetical protein [Luteimonas aestuarii]|uniref:hypothetical protein n=1 Tax=Luteimonas aestuarii TaxID=453837 RepID=UPI001404A325|nr:hypothetical protein [Luteimonas aestuarii]
MRSSPRRHLSYASFMLLLAADVLVLSIVVLDQLLTVPEAWLVGLSAVLTLAAMPALLKLSDAVFAMARRHRNVPWTGESFP